MKNIHFKIRISRLFTTLFLFSLVFCLWLSHIPLNTSVNAQTPNAEQLVNQGVKYYSSGDYQTAIKQWLEALKIYQNNQNINNEVIVRENLARTYPEVGRISEAIKQWEEVTAIYRQLKNTNRVGLSLVEQAQLYSNLGQSRKAIAILCNKSDNDVCTDDSVLKIARTVKDANLEAVALGALGDAYRLSGDYDKAIVKLESSLKIARQLKNQDYIILATNSLGNAYNSQALLNYRRADLAAESADNANASQEFIRLANQKDTQALSYLNQGLNLAKKRQDYQAQVQALRSIIPIYYRTNNSTAVSTLQQAIKLLEFLPKNRARLYATIDLANLLQNTSSNGRANNFKCGNSDYLPQAESLLKQAENISNKIGDSRGKSFAQGELGHIYECQKQYDKALFLTQQARFSAEQDLQAKNSLYLWEWQAGRILKAQNKTDEAISAYSLAMNTLEDIRQDILTANRDIQFDFRDTIEPIYRDVVELRLSLESSRQATNKSLVNNERNDNLTSVISTVNSLKLAQLQNYFGNNCIVDAFIQTEVEQVIDNTTAVFSTVILENETAIILSLPDGRKEYRLYKTPYNKLFAEINEYRQAVQKQRDRSFEVLKPAQSIYEWMIAPFEESLQKNGIETLVFIHDGILQSIPMAPLYDGKQYLIEKYAIATTPSLSLTNPKPLNRQNLQVLALGLTEAAKVDGNLFPALNYVEAEIDGIKQQIPGKKLLDAQFTRDNLEKELKQEIYPVIHLATHGQFGTDPDNTFIVTGNNQKLTFSQLDRLIRSVTRNREPLELLTLTACETAVGNNRSALGLAGVAIQAGAKSAIASLWTINDNATAVFATDFYTQLLSNPQSKAKALQAAQIKFIKGEGNRNQHPAYWSPFILIGNWL